MRSWEWAPHDGMSALTRRWRDTRTLSIFHVSTQEEGSHQQARKRALTRSKNGEHLGFKLSSLLYRKKHLLLPLNLWDICYSSQNLGHPWWHNFKQSNCQWRVCWFDPWVGRIPWKRKWQPTPVFLSGKSHGQRSLEGYSTWGQKESDMT